MVVLCVSFVPLFFGTSVVLSVLAVDPGIVYSWFGMLVASLVQVFISHSDSLKPSR